MGNVRWTSFHSGYDFGYLLKVLTCNRCPPETEFFELLNIFFPCFTTLNFDEKLQNLKGITCRTSLTTWAWSGLEFSTKPARTVYWLVAPFFKLKKVYFEDRLDDSRYSGRLYGIGAGMSLTPADQQGLLFKQITPNSILIDPSAQ